MEKKVLLIGYYYPPDSGVGSIRISKFAKFLPKQWNIHVLTTPSSAESRSNQYNVTVHEIPRIWPATPKSFDQTRWVPQLLKSVRKLHKQHEFDCVWQTANPFFPLIIVPICNKFISSNFIVDLRDSWTLHPYSDLTTIFGRLYAKTSQLLEPRVLRSADAVTVATDGINEAYANLYPEIKNKLHTIENGYDRDDFPQLETEPREGFDIVYVGKFSDFRDPNPFLNALSDIQFRYDVSFIHVGNSEEQVENAVRQYDLEQNYECTGYVGREEVARWIQRSDLGLAVSGGSPQEMTTKIFDYMACRTPILGCGPKGAMTDVIEQFEFGYVSPNETNQIKDTLSKIIDRKPHSLGSGPYSRYTRKESAKKLTNIIESLDE
jgi:glycosyltransferase involved in cell wall biosynthesis